MEPDSYESLKFLLSNLQQENEMLRNRPSLEPNVSLPLKYDGNKSEFRSFVSQVKLIFQLQPLRFSTDFLKTGFIGTLLIGPAAAWFASLFENGSESLKNIDQFLKEFSENFGDLDRATVAANKLHNLRQGCQSASTYAAQFRLLSCDLNWCDEVLIDLFRRGLRDEVKDLLLTLPFPKTLNEAISSAVKCDNRLLERRMEKSRQGWTTRNANTPVQQGPVPMEVDVAKERTKHMSPLTNEERERRRRENLCLYCGEVGHFLKNCPRRPGNQGKVRVRPF